MSVSFVIDGIDELKAALRQLPEELVGAASAIVLDRAHAAADEIRRNYGSAPQTKFLESEVTVREQASRVRVAAVVVCKDGWARLFEVGAMNRHDGQRSYGSILPAHAFIPPMERQRRAMYQELAEMLRRWGFQVTYE